MKKANLLKMVKALMRCRCDFCTYCVHKTECEEDQFECEGLTTCAEGVIAHFEQEDKSK